MHWNKAAAAGLTAALLLAGSVSSAQARWYGHRGPGPVAGLVGGVVVGAATIATLPFALLAGAARPAPPPPAYYGPPAYAYPPPPPPRYYRYGPPPGYYGYYGGY
jgi:hypothetical protein